MEMNDVPAPTTRTRHGRWLGGVCAGLAARWDVPVARVRLGFVFGSLALGIGVLAYIAAWLILPGDGDSGGQRGIVLLAQACGALLGLVTLAAAGAVATVFGFGWVVVALAAAVLVGTLAGWTRLGPAWALLPVGALVLPSVAMAVGGVQVDPSTSSRTLAPHTAADLSRTPVRSGLGLVTIDLRRSVLPATGVIPLKIEAGVRRTLIALPHDRCVHVKVTEHDTPVLLQLGAVFVGRSNDVTPSAEVFGRPPGEWGSESRTAGPTLAIDFSSAGGRLVVRDYPDDINPNSQPNWPGYPVFIEDQPDTTAVSSAADRKAILRDWRARRKIQERTNARIDRQSGGPCTAKR
jgi:phage shock protein PspC (stress-responsive transcriptional regulator)